MSQKPLLPGCVYRGTLHDLHTVALYTVYYISSVVGPTSGTHPLQAGSGQDPLVARRYLLVLPGPVDHLLLRPLVGEPVDVNPEVALPEAHAGGQRVVCFCLRSTNHRTKTKINNPIPPIESEKQTSEQDGPMDTGRQAGRQTHTQTDRKTELVLQRTRARNPIDDKETWMKPARP